MLDFLLLFTTLLSLLAISCVMVIYLGVKSHLSPLLTLCLTTSLLSLFAMVGMAFYTAIAILLLGLVAAVVTVYKVVRDRSLLDKFNNLGFYSFILLSLFIITLFSIREPMFYEWDEFSFWGTAARIVSESNLLYTVAENNMVGVTHPPALIMVSYFFNFLGDFAPHKTYIGYDILMFSAMSAAVGCFERKLKHLSVVTLLVLVSSPFIAMNIHGRSVQILPGYMSAYADYPMGIMLCGALVVYFCSQGNRVQSLLVSASALFVLTLSKEMGFAFAMLGAGIIAADLIIANRELSLPKRIVASIALISTPIVSFASWSMHLSAALGLNRSEVGGEQNLGMVELLLTGVTELFIPSARSEKFTAVFDNLVNAFINHKIALIGSGLIVFLMVTVLLAAAFIFTEDKKNRPSILIYYIMTTLGCIAYTVFLGFTYVYVFKGDDGVGLISYERYVLPYYTAWIFATFVYTLFILRNKPRLHFLIQPALVAVGCGLFILAHYTTPSYYNYLNYPDSYFSSQREIQNKVEVAMEYIEPDSNVFYIHSRDNGIGWFQNYYYFLPIHIDYSGGGDLARFDSESLRQYFIDNSIDMVFIDYIDSVAQPAYASLFTDAFTEYEAGKTYLYSVITNGDEVSLHPVVMEE